MDSTDFRQLEPLIRSCLGKFCKPSRIEHSISVAETAQALCLRFGLDGRKGFLAGLAHDLMKDRPLADQWEYARRAASNPCLDSVALAVERIESEKAFADKIIHGPSAAAFLCGECGLKDRDMLEAMAFHSSAAIVMSPLAKIVYVSDKLEPRRPYMKAEDETETGRLDLDGLMVRALELSIGWLRGNGQAIAQSTIDLYNALTMRVTLK